MVVIKIFRNQDFLGFNNSLIIIIIIIIIIMIIIIIIIIIMEAMRIIIIIIMKITNENNYNNSIILRFLRFRYALFYFYLMLSVSRQQIFVQLEQVIDIFVQSEKCGVSRCCLEMLHHTRRHLQSTA